MGRVHPMTAPRLLTPPADMHAPTATRTIGVLMRVDSVIRPSRARRLYSEPVRLLFVSREQIRRATVASYLLKVV